jgi:mannose-1-phosphate guanylyltransferase
MKAVVLVGGFGTRLRPVTYAVPKQLIPLAGKPMLYHVFDLFPPEVDEAVLASGYKADVLDAYVRRHPPRLKVRTVPEAEPLGTGGGLRNAADDLSDPFLLVNSDVISDVDVAGLIALHRSKGGIGAMTLAEVEDTKPYGVAALDAENRITRFVEKPEPKDAPSHWINAGLQIWRREVVDSIPTGRAVSWEQEIVPGLVDKRIYGYLARGYWEDAGTPARILRAQRLLFDDQRGGSGKLPKGARGSGPVAVGEEVRAENATFGPYVTLSDRVVVETGAHVENSIVMEGATIGREASVLNSVLGPRARVASGHRVQGSVVGEGAEA